MEKMDSTKIYFVYWLHLSSFTDPFKEGYIGITLNPHKRFIQHKTAANNNVNNTHIIHAINKYGINNIKMTILHENESISMASALEHYYRPKKNIG